MPRLRSFIEVYNSGNSAGFYRNKGEINNDKIKLLMKNAEINENSAKIIAKNIAKTAKEWMNVYTLYYESLRIYAEALLLLKKLDCSNHQCLFAALFVKYPKLDLDWSFFEKIRTKRNGVNYYGSEILYSDWKEVDIQIKLYLSLFRKIILEELSN